MRLTLLLGYLMPVFLSLSLPRSRNPLVCRLSSSSTQLKTYHQYSGSKSNQANSLSLKMSFPHQYGQLMKCSLGVSSQLNLRRHSIHSLFTDSNISPKGIRSIPSPFKLHDMTLRSSATDNMDLEESENRQGQAISWYPGHIAKAERELTDYLKKVDVVIEVRDARIPLATTHPKILEWIGKKPVIVVMLRIDQISDYALNAWKQYYKVHGPHDTIQRSKDKSIDDDLDKAKIFFINGKLGTNIPSLKKEILKAGAAVNERRIRKGIQPRAVRAAVIGYPNVGKSALINRLLGRNMAKSRNLPGVTKALTWVRLGGSNVRDLSQNSATSTAALAALTSGSLIVNNSQENIIELLDSPGIIPAKQLNQENAIKLAICNDIGEASYDRVIIATEMCNYLNNVHKMNPKAVDMKKIESRYFIPFSKMTGDEIIYHITESDCHGNSLAAADKLLSDFRKNYITYGTLELPPRNVEDRHISPASKSKKVSKNMQLKSVNRTDDDDIEYIQKDVDAFIGSKRHSESNVEEKQRAAAVSDEDISSLDIGRGSYDGW